MYGIYLKSFGLCTLLWAILFPCVNLVIDPYDVFGTKFLPVYGEPQERFLKIEFLKNHRSFDTFLLGSSRVGTTRTEDVERFLPGAHAYNLTLSMASPADMLTHAKWLIEHYGNLRTLFVQVDWPLENTVLAPQETPLTRLHPDIAGQNRYLYLGRYLFSPNLEADEAKIRKSLRFDDRMSYDMTKGYWSFPLREREIETDCKTYVQGEAMFHKNYAGMRISGLSPKSRFVLDRRLESLAKLIELSRTHSVKVVVYLTPHNHRFLQSIGLESYEYFLRGLSAITPFWNFSVFTAVTQDDCNYYESSHYRAPVAREMYRLMLVTQRGSGEVELVDSQNIEAHLAFVRRNFAKHQLPSLEPRS